MKIKQTQIDEIVQSEISKDAKFWYKSPACSKTRENTFAKEILKEKNLKKLDSIIRINRENYNANHMGETEKDNSNRLEERIALELFNRKDCFSFGKIIDYQVPLKCKQSDKGIGKIDLLAYDDSKKVLTLLELKKPDSDETLLRAVLEVYTYSKLVCEKNLIKSYDYINSDSKIEKAVFLFKNSYAYKEYEKACADKDNSYIYKLMKKLNVKFYCLDFEFTVSEYKTNI